MNKKPWDLGPALLMLFLAGSAFAHDNPAALYCTAMGYTYEVENLPGGAQHGRCTLPDRTTVDAWEFLRGRIAPQYSYCERIGQRIHTLQEDKQGYLVEVPVCESTGPQGQMQQAPMLEIMQARRDIAYQGKRRPIPQNIPTTPAPTAFSLDTPKQASYPATFDWRSFNGKSYIGGVRDQGNCGACYAFGAAAAAEGAYNVINGLSNERTVDFSESYIAWCLGAHGPYSSHFSGCDGADYDYAELTALTVEGISFETSFPYRETDPGRCTHQNDRTVKFKRWGRINPLDSTGIQQALSTYGVIDVAVDVTADFENYRSGIFSDKLIDCPDGAYTQTNHAVALVGWGTDSTQGLYWILRNSWGTAWGENGYMRIADKAARVACSATFLEAKPGSSGPNPSTLMFLLD